MGKVCLLFADIELLFSMLHKLQCRAMMVSNCSAMILNTIKEGKIVPSEVTVKLIGKAIKSSENDRFLIDGFPRSEENRMAYERVVSFFYNSNDFLSVL